MKDIKMIKQNNISVLQIPSFKQKVVLRGALLSEVYKTRNVVNIITIKEQSKAIEQLQLKNQEQRLKNIDLEDKLLNDSLFINSKDVEIKGLNKTIKGKKVENGLLKVSIIALIAGILYTTVK